MPCVDYENKTWVNWTQKQIIEQLIQTTKIQANVTKAAMNKKISRPDARTSSKVVGLSGAIILIVVFSCILFLDMSTLCRHCKIKHY